MSQRKFFLSVVICIVCFFSVVSFADQENYNSRLEALKFRNIGPAIMGGRVVDFAVVESNTSIIYAAIGPSGVWKSENNGITWFPVFDKEATVAVGAVAVSQSAPDIVWVGSGEATARNSVGIGDGAYKSEDGGRTWKNMGLKNTQHIAKVIIDRTNPDIVYVGAMGHEWGPNKERGVFKTIDGGITWEKVLYVDESTGIADLASDPSNPKIIYAAMWDFQRKAYHFRSGGKGSAIYKTTDGGGTWKKIIKGLPSGEYGRIGLDVCYSNPNVVYAVVENKNSGVFRSEDKGENWIRMCDSQTHDRINFRPFYYSRITVDPNNDLVVYVYSGSSYVSRDGGKTFSSISRGTHPDHHAMWVNPHNSLHLLDGNDGGIDISFDGGLSWRGVRAGAWSEVYQVGYDMRTPYYAYVGLQDNGSWGAPINSLDSNGIMNFHWYPIGGGDGFYIQIDPEDYSTIYRNAHMGGITRFDVKTGDSQDIKPVAKLDEEPYRFNWNSPIQISPHNRNVVYFGGNFLFKTTDRGKSWEKISPDLSSDNPEKQKDSGGVTADNTGAEIHCTIYTISESPLKEGIIWIGTDDGFVQLTTDGGTTWTNLTDNIKGLPPEGWVTRIEASHFDEETAYVTFDLHRVDDNKPYIYKTDNFGKTWTSLSTDLPSFGYLHVVREDLENKNLLYVGSEFGLFLSFDGGIKWMAYKNDFPTVAVRDIQIHPRERDLLVGTHGRGLWVLDDIKPLEQMTSEVLDSTFALFDIRQATLYSSKSSSMYSGPHEYSAPNPPFGAGINYYLKEKPKADDILKMSVVDSEGQEVAFLRTTNNRGLNRIYWNLREQRTATVQPTVSQGRSGRGSSGGPFVLPGRYTVVLQLNDNKIEKNLTVNAYEKHTFTLEERKLNQKFVADIGSLVNQGTSLISSMTALLEQLESLEIRIKAEKMIHPDLEKMLNDLKSKVSHIQEAYSYSVEGATGYRRPVIVALRGGTLPEQVSRLRSSVSRYQGAPSQTQIDQYNDIKSTVTPLFELADEIQKTDIPTLNTLLNEMKFPFIKISR
ncbi:WD40/YVTN/BNR-like repeat-containing protein [Acidobacteriota bacterium]